MTTAADGDTQRLVSVLDRLGRMAVESYYNPYRMFEWPDSLPTDRPWMSPALLSVHGTSAQGELDEQQLLALSRWESVNFYSLNVHGIRELLTEVINRVHTPGFEIASEFFHHFIGEENEHMWFFAEFCRRYGGRMYRFPRLRTSTAPIQDPDVESFLVFSRILIFEEIVDHYNAHMAVDESLHPTVREINRIHHKDESRHIAAGRELVTMLHARLRRRHTAAELRSIGAGLQEYLRFSLHSFYSLDAYEDAGIADPLAFRRRLIEDPRRQEIDRSTARKPVSFFRRLGVFEEVTAR
ncbi:diiron oxygenase [Kitasatospora sp. NPDC050543]|uniref:diiron oxygenase n=1 Tax=Kitasatospora sp. NPDC050543 TaxID=3364054 RepID=UPI0037963C63